MTAVARSRSTDRRYYGIAEAVVVDANDPQHEGRVRLRLPWFDRDMVTDWCRVCQFYAGNGYGAFFMPEKDDEVAVSFVHGDLRLPIVLGGLYNGKDLPATRRAADNDVKQLRTKAGHVVELVDTDGKETIRIVERGNKHSIEISTADNAIRIEASGGKLVLKADEIEIHAVSTLKIESGAEMTLKGATIALN